MYYSARKLYGHKVNFGEILKAAVADRQLIRGIAYVVRATGEEDAFFKALNAHGLETREREVQIFEDGARKADWDVGMAVDAIRMAETLDTVVLVSGDGDFIELVQYLQSRGRRVEAIAFRETCSSKLIDQVDDFINLSDERDRFLVAATAVEPTTPRRPQGTPKHPSDAVAPLVQRPTAPLPKPVQQVQKPQPPKPVQKPAVIQPSNRQNQPANRVNQQVNRNAKPQGTNLPKNMIKPPIIKPTVGRNQPARTSSPPQNLPRQGGRNQQGRQSQSVPRIWGAGTHNE